MVVTAGGPQGGIDVRRSGERFHTRLGWLDSQHSFSFGRHYDPRNTHFGLLLVSNHDVVAPGSGFETHPHRDMEIVTWVLGGQLVHQDSAGHAGLIHPGLAQRMSAGAGILHSEKHDGRAADPVEFVQMWVLPDAAGIAPSYDQLDVSPELAGGGWVPVASGREPAAITIRQGAATLWAAILPPATGALGASTPAGPHGAARGGLRLPEAPYVHLYVARGSVELEGASALDTGDAARIAGGGQLITAGPDGAELLAWEMHAAAGPS